MIGIKTFQQRKPGIYRNWATASSGPKDNYFYPLHQSFFMYSLSLGLGQSEVQSQYLNHRRDNFDWTAGGSHDRLSARGWWISSACGGTRELSFSISRRFSTFIKE